MILRRIWEIGELIEVKIAVFYKRRDTLLSFKTGRLYAWPLAYRFSFPFFLNTEITHPCPLKRGTPRAWGQRLSLVISFLE